VRFVPHPGSVLAIVALSGCGRTPDSRPTRPAEAAPSAAESSPLNAAPEAASSPDASGSAALAASAAVSSPTVALHATKDGWVAAALPDDSKHVPLVALMESGSLVRSRLPILVVYQDGLVLRRSSERATNLSVHNKHLYPSDMRMARLPAAEVAALVAAMWATGIEAAPSQTRVVSVTEQPFADIVLWKGGRWKVTSVFGITHRDGEPVRSDDGPMSAVPAAFVAAYRKLLAFEPKSLSAWVPEEVIATLSQPAKDARAVAWPAGLPAPARRGGTVTPLRLSGKEAVAMLEWNRKLGSPWDVLEKKPGRSDVEVAGERWLLTVKGMVPHGDFLERVRLAAVMAQW
jgi:hypothetical protein